MKINKNKSRIDFVNNNELDHNLLIIILCLTTQVFTVEQHK